MSEYQNITVLKNEIQARLLDTELKKRKIPHFLRTYHDAAYNGIYQQQKGWGIVEAPIEYKEDIMTILKDIE
ncbi:MAG: hypothetical protein J7L86_02745 [Candidatus Marinimicrobia bacterium]|nr:hypothetical protein [Candidatus Neomarinimicrobiota bacterium]